MTTLKETIKADLTVGLKARNELVTTTLRNLTGTVQTQEKAGKEAKEFSDEQILTVINQEVKKRRDTAEIYAKAGATERAERELAEVDVLAKYLPTQLSEAEVEALVDAEIAKLEAPTAKSFGLVMKSVLAEAKGQTDGKTVSALVKRKLG